MNRAKKIGATLVLACSLFCGFAFSFFGSVKNVKAEEQKTIAVYVIAGQSNAAGYSLVSQVNAAYKTEHAEGFENVRYYGRSDGRYWNDFNTTVNFGLGYLSDRFGSEIGIAEKHMAAYPDEEAIIVKYAVGGTYLVDTDTSFTRANGNWSPPSHKDKYSQGELSGKLYRGLIETLTTVVEHYKQENYTIDFKGTFWMQGEAETDKQSNVDLYEDALTTLISDLRSDYAKILNDETAKQSPFIIGKICPTFNKANDDGYVGQIRKIQDSVAAKTDKVYLVETEDYPMVDPQSGKSRGPDYFHFEGNDMLSLGQDVGNMFVTIGKPHVRVKVNGYGKANTSEYVFLDSTETPSVTFTATKEHWVINSVLYDGTDVTDKLVNGTFTISDTSGLHDLIATFGKEPKYSITLDADENAINVVRNPISKGYYVGEKVTIEISAKTGYKIDDVTFNGNAISANGGQYEVTITDGENKLIVNAVTDGTSANPNMPDESENGNSSVDNKEEKSGCASSIGAGISIFAILCVAVFGLVKRRKSI